MIEQSNLKSGSSERFQYDDLQRLKSSTLYYGATSKSYNYDYDSVGNLLHKSDYATAMNYDPNGQSASNNWAGPNAVSSITRTDNTVINFKYDKSGNMVSGDGLSNATYNFWNKPTIITRDSVSLSFLYGPNKMRHKQVRSGSNPSTLYYYDSLFEIETTDGKTAWRAYIGDVAIVGQSEQLGYYIRFTHKDRLGSTTTMTDHNGSLVESREFDAFGKPRDVSNLELPSWQVKLNDSQLGVRGFTDHEHLDEVQLIHMNGRVYDYDLGRFLSVDPFVHEGSQGLNPYSYIMNNPLSGTDPTGYSPEEVEKKVKVSTTGSRIKRTVTVSATKDGGIKLSGGGKAAQNAVAGAILNGAKSLSKTASSSSSNTMDIGSQKDINSNNNQNLSSSNNGATDEGRDIVHKMIDYDLPARNPDNSQIELYDSSGEWKDTIVDEIVSGIVGFLGGIPKKPDLTSGVSMPTGFQYRRREIRKVPVYEKYQRKASYSVSKKNPKDIKLLGIYSEKLNRKVYKNIRKSELIRTDYQLRHCNNGSCSAGSTYLWNNNK